MPHKKSSRTSRQKSKNSKKYDLNEDDGSEEKDENNSDSSVFKKMAINQNDNKK